MTTATLPPLTPILLPTALQVLIIGPALFHFPHPAVPQRRWVLSGAGAFRCQCPDYRSAQPCCHSETAMALARGIRAAQHQGATPLSVAEAMGAWTTMRLPLAVLALAWVERQAGPPSTPLGTLLGHVRLLVTALDEADRHCFALWCLEQAMAQFQAQGIDPTPLAQAQIRNARLWLRGLMTTAQMTAQRDALLVQAERIKDDDANWTLAVGAAFAAGPGSTFAALEGAAWSARAIALLTTSATTTHTKLHVKVRRQTPPHLLTLLAHRAWLCQRLAEKQEATCL